MLKTLDGSITQSIFKFGGLAFFDISIGNPECLVPTLPYLFYIVPSVVISMPIVVWLVMPAPSPALPLPSHGPHDVYRASEVPYLTSCIVSHRKLSTYITLSRPVQVAPHGTRSDGITNHAARSPSSRSVECERAHGTGAQRAESTQAVPRPAIATP